MVDVVVAGVVVVSRVGVAVVLEWVAIAFSDSLAQFSSVQLLSRI